MWYFGIGIPLLLFLIYYFFFKPEENIVNLEDADDVFDGWED